VYFIDAEPIKERVYILWGDMYHAYRSFAESLEWTLGLEWYPLSLRIGLGIGVMEMSHRSPEYVEINNKTNNQLRTLLNVPENYKILFM
jgi:hypothetical protein